MLPPLTLESLKLEAAIFTRALSVSLISNLYGVTDGKAVGTYVEHAFQTHLQEHYTIIRGNSALGIESAWT
jgi:hypothetical protein